MNHNENDPSFIKALNFDEEEEQLEQKDILKISEKYVNNIPSNPIKNNKKENLSDVVNEDINVINKICSKEERQEQQLNSTQHDESHEFFQNKGKENEVLFNEIQNNQSVSLSVELSEQSQLNQKQDTKTFDYYDPFEPDELTIEGFYDILEDSDFLCQEEPESNNKEPIDDDFTLKAIFEDDDLIELMTFLDLIKDHPNDHATPVEI